MHDPHLNSLLDQFRQALADCRQLYTSSGQLIASQHANQLKGPPQKFVQLMDDLHKGLLIKIYITVAEADKRWSYAERLLAEVLFRHIWNQPLEGDALREAVVHISQQATKLKWYSLIRPFDKVEALRERIAELETVVMRVANIVAKCDGEPRSSEMQALQIIQAEFMANLHPLQVDERVDHTKSDSIGAQAVQVIEQESQQVHEELELKDDGTSAQSTDKSNEEVLKESLEQLAELIGMDNVKHEVRTLINFLKMQKQREEAGLPKTNISLHMVFCGNPGTGKTTVARIIGQIYGAMGILEKGHMIETDRSGLVAEYAGQTGPKTNKKIDEAMDGVLFIDEAYSLVSEKGDDAFGQEAIQTLLKRMEDDRDRLVVIMAGYPEQMDRLLKSNPGLSSRFTYSLQFEDYTPGQLGRIFGIMCEKNHYEVVSAAQSRLLVGFQWMYDHRDEHFGNGRTVRNTFERAIRKLANRIASITQLTKDLLTTFELDDIDMKSVPESTFEGTADQVQFKVACPNCENSAIIPADYLAKRLKCNKCDHRFVAAWGEPQIDS